MANTISGFGTPAQYEISVKGFLPTHIWDVFRGLSLVEEANTTNDNISKLLARVQDQAELIGLLNVIHDWHLVIVSLNVVQE